VSLFFDHEGRLTDAGVIVFAPVALLFVAMCHFVLLLHWVWRRIWSA
jgi:hypothetical protein